METFDLSLAAYLTYRGFNVIDIKTDEGLSKRRKSFVFAKKQGMKIEDEARSFFNKKTTVEPLDYFNAIKLMKDRIYSTGSSY